MNVLDQLERAAAEEAEDKRYLFVDKLGQGGMGQVWLAEKLGPDGTPFRTVVIKTIIPTGSDAEVQRRTQMFMREMAVAARLEHPNVVRVTDWGDNLFGSTPFFEMERIKGISLLALLAARGVPLSEEEKWGALPPEDVAWIGHQAAAGLHYAHNFARTGEDDTLGGVAHRDVTPDNLMVDIEGVVKVADWGITKALNAAGEASRTGMIAGKVKYMAPEQLRGKIDLRADIYGLGVTLAVALSGKPVFPSSQDETWESIAIRVIQGERPTVAQLAPGAPPALQQLLERMMALDPAQRPASAGELVDAFAEITEQLGGSLYAVKKAFAERVREHHKEGLRTKRAIDAAHQEVPSYSTRRPISAATHQDQTPAPGPVSGSTQPLGAAVATQALSSEASVSFATPAEPPASSRRPWLILALAGSVLVLLALVAGVVGFMVAGRTEPTPTPTPDAPIAQPAPHAPPLEPPGTPTATEAPSPADEPAAIAAEAPAVAEPTPAVVEPSAELPAETSAPESPSPAPAPSAARPRAHSRSALPPPPSPQQPVQPRPLAPQPTPQSQRATERRPGLSDFGF
ncbi:MAG: serine/threonine protein kinase [Myxococcales bacterium]|nr:serine/threonine protein kinase [Myxococcales bacterium]